MTAKHTPGPWSWRREGGNPSWEIVASATRQVIAACVWSTFHGDIVSTEALENGEANAKLIASAPEQQAKIDALADALEAISTAWDAPHQLGLHLAINKARTALCAAGRLP